MEPLNDPLHYFDARAETAKQHHVLPHWQQEGVTYFVTFRLADALPEERLQRWRLERAAWCALHPKPWDAQTERSYHERFSSKVERWLDQNHGSCLLRQPEWGQLVQGALKHFEGQRSRLHASVVMPNHVHALVTLLPDQSLPEILHSWKSYTAHALRQSLGGDGELWQRSYFDRIIRDERHFRNCVRYIRRNPGKARLPAGQFQHHESSWVQTLDIR